MGSARPVWVIVDCIDSKGFPPRMMIFRRTEFVRSYQGRVAHISVESAIMLLYARLLALRFVCVRIIEV